MYSRKSFSPIFVCVFCEVSHLILEFALFASLQGLIEGFRNECDREVYLTQHMFNDFALNGMKNNRQTRAVGVHLLILSLTRVTQGRSNSAVSEGTLNFGSNLIPEPRVYAESNVHPNLNIGLKSSDLNPTEVAINLTTRNSRGSAGLSPQCNCKYWRPWL